MLPLSKSDQLDVELGRPADLPAFILIKWPAAPSVVAPTPKAIANVTAALVRTLAEAQSKLAAIRTAGGSEVPPHDRRTQLFILDV